MKFLKSIALGAAIAGGTLLASPALAHVVVGVSVGFPPPAPRVERVAAWPGHAWIPGYWRWNGARHVWAAGYWAGTRPGYRYAAARWITTGPAWRLRAGYWYR